MKFWQKAFFCTIALFLIGFDLMGIMLTRRSYSLVHENTLRTAEREERDISTSLYTGIALSLRQYESLNAENLRVTVKPYADYYETQGVYLAVYQDGLEQFTSFPFAFDYAAYRDEATENTAETREIGGRLYCIIYGYEDTSYNNLQFVYMKDVQSLADFGREITGSAILICTVVSLVLAAVLLLMLLGLTRPFRRLNAAAAEISMGHYDRRVAVKGRDEVGEFAASFNAMADSVEARINEMTAVNEMKEAFINNLSHEMRTPITAVLGYAELLKIANCSQEEQDAAVDYIISQGQRMRSMSEKLMGLADLSGRPIQKQQVEWEPVLSGAVQTCTPLIRGKNIRVERSVRCGTVQGDAVLLESLAQNLLENAIKASREGEAILLETFRTEDDGGSVLEITDHGRGMEQSEIARVTEPFYRVDKARSRAEGGVGLGLSICLRICEAHGATLDIRSAPGESTTVQVRFPNA